jgi:hypothetical protein
MSKARYLTKSRFKVASECPTKLAYLDDSRYGNRKDIDSFLAALAEGGFQVGELAKIYYPGGIEISERDHHQAAAITAEHISRGPCTLFEAAFLHERLFVRVDVLKWDGHSVELIEVKAKSYHPDEDETFFSKRPPKGQMRALLAEWEPYLLDVAFQTYVIQQCMPGVKVRPYLMLADKSSRATVDGLNQKFFLSSQRPGQKREVLVSPGTGLDTVGRRILAQVDVSEPVDFILGHDFNSFQNFGKYLAYLTQYLEGEKKHPPLLSNTCKSCEFRIDPSDFASPKKSGFQECWMKATSLSEQQLSEPLVLDLWNFRRTNLLLEEGRYLLREVEEEDINPKEGESGLSPSERQWLQVMKARERDDTPYIDLQGLAAEVASWRFPLHFIDFETTTVAIPFYKGQAPYETIAFQFSHHVMHEDGRIEHKDQFLFTERGVFPNFTFLRSLKRSLEGDHGTIFRYAAHENTVLCQIMDQLRASQEPDRDSLIQWIQTVTKSTSRSDVHWVGERNMVDLCDLVKRFFYHPATNGSNSIKKVLPSILNSSPFLQEKYAKATYGSSDMPSLNFREKAWLALSSDGSLLDPYKQLDPIFPPEDQLAIERIYGQDEIADGGAAMTAYAMLQFSQMSDREAEDIKAALLRYCELDTLAMVMLVEHWRYELQITQIAA